MTPVSGAVVVAPKRKTFRLQADVPDLDGARRRFLAKVRIEGEHWSWTTTSRDEGDLPPPGHVVTLCPDAVRCVRPSHLRDMLKSEHSAGQKYRAKGDETAHKISAREVRRIIHWRKRGWTLERIAEKFRISDGMVSHILSGRAWSSITGIPQRARRAVALKAQQE